jgi:hypothetical protein
VLNGCAIRSPPFKRLGRMHTHVTIYNLEVTGTLEAT